MENSRLLVEQACEGVRPAHTPIFDLLLNDAIIEHFAGEPLDGLDDKSTCVKAARNALDGTRFTGIPYPDGTTFTDEQGNLHITARWTEWIRVHSLTTQDQWIRWIKWHIETLESLPWPTVAMREAEQVRQQHVNDQLHGTAFIHCTPSTAINDMLFGQKLGLTWFSYLWADERDLMLHWFRALEREQRRVIELIANRQTSNLAMIYSDVAFKHHPMFSPATFREFGFFDDVASICAACHERGLKVIFHSDGDITSLVDDLVATGIDGLNPLEKAAGVDVYALRRRYPQLILVGGVDVTHLLGEGSPDQIRQETRHLIRELGSEGHLLIGSSTEVSSHVPLLNYLAFRDEALRI